MLHIANNKCHLDLKPANMVFNNLLGISLIDFGLASDMNLTLKGDRGTKGYMAPEVQMGYEYEPASADIFSLGICLFTIMALREPFGVDLKKDPLFNCLIQGNVYKFL